MNTPLLQCNNCNNSERGSFSILKDKREQLLSSSDENNNSTNNLEIIDYPYSLNYNKKETFQLNGTDINGKVVQNIESYNNDLKKPNILEDGGNNYLSRNFNIRILNNSSGIINNEESITQNKNL